MVTKKVSKEADCSVVEHFVSFLGNEWYEGMPRLPIYQQHHAHHRGLSNALGIVG